MIVVRLYNYISAVDLLGFDCVEILLSYCDQILLKQCLGGRSMKPLPFFY